MCYPSLAMLSDDRFEVMVFVFIFCQVLKV